MTFSMWLKRSRFFFFFFSWIGWKTLWKKEKMLVTSVFSFFHNVFKWPFPKRHQNSRPYCSRLSLLLNGTNPSKSVKVFYYNNCDRLLLSGKLLQSPKCFISFVLMFLNMDKNYNILVKRYYICGKQLCMETVPRKRSTF